MSRDILFRTDDFIFSYRVAGILIENGNILLQKPKSDDGYAIPGGHVSFGEVSSETLIREYKEEIHADIYVDKLLYVGEIFFPWGNKPCQQIGLYYSVSLADKTQIPMSGTFSAFDELENERIDLDFIWVPLSQLKNVELYPTNVKEYLLHPRDSVEHFVYRET